MKDIDKGFKEAIKKLQTLKNKTLQAGILKDTGTNEGVYIADYASWNEYGTEDIPARPFVGSTCDEQSSKWNGVIDKIIDKILVDPSTDVERLINLLGEQVVGDIKEKIANNIPPPNTEGTIRRKKSTKTLIDTGVMRNAITFEIIGK